jgi:KUP system potassium uptake protein
MAEEPVGPFMGSWSPARDRALREIAMTSVEPPGPAPPRVAEAITPTLALTALGIVYGDIGTSPLYTLQAVAQAVGGPLRPAAALGSLSLIFWALISTISFKYCVFVMRADNNGEGGILALMSMIGTDWVKRRRVFVVMGLFGAALIYGDGIITPAISVLSALEGLNVGTEASKPYVVPMAVAILLVLFGIQSRGTAVVGKAFGPIMLIWFATIALLGLAGIARHPGVLLAADPRYAIGFLVADGWSGFAVLGAVFLAITGAEALYADMGHIGRGPIRAVWYAIVLPALLMNYAGQTAMFLDDPARQGSPFFALAPDWAILPLVGLATLATIIASQAIITGSFSLTRQAMQLGWFPGVRIRQTSAEQYGQIYVPFVNWTMMVLTLALTIGFASSDRLAGAYGTAVSTTMLLTTALLYKVMRDRWRWPPASAIAVSGAFLVVDLAFFCANLLKIGQGGWIPLVFASVIFVVMTTWRFGIDALHREVGRAARPPADFFKQLRSKKIPRVPGTAIFLTRLDHAISPLIVAYVAQTGALHETVVALTVGFDAVPRVPPESRLQAVQLSEDFWHLTVRYGFVEIPDLPAALRLAKTICGVIDPESAIYFGAADEVVRGRKRAKLARWRLPLFAFMLRNSLHAVDLFKIPSQNYVEIGHRVEI